MPIESSHAVDCVYCAGKGCEECGGTGQRYTHLIREQAGGTDAD